MHDLSKFSRAEWSPYVAHFYGKRSQFTDSEPGARREAFDRIAAFNAAWLHHIHVNPHHWQYHVLHEDSGKMIVLLPDSVLVDEMLADWLSAGPKVAFTMSMQDKIAMTIVWYAENSPRMMLRDPVRQRVEATLCALAESSGVADAAREIKSMQRARQSIAIPGR